MDVGGEEGPREGYALTKVPQINRGRGGYSPYRLSPTQNFLLFQRLRNPKRDENIVITKTLLRQRCTVRNHLVKLFIYTGGKT